MINYVLGPLLFIVLAFTIYRKVTSHSTAAQMQDLVNQALSDDNKPYIVALFALMCANWAIEARKWQILIKTIQNVSYFTAIKSVLSGLSFSLFAPNGIGDFVGRMAYMNEGNRLRSLAVTSVGGMGQMLVTLVAGLTGLVYLQNVTWLQSSPSNGFAGLWVKGVTYIIAICTLILGFIYYQLSALTTLVEKIPFVYKYRYLIETVEGFHWKLLTRVLVLAIIRFVVFVVQYLLMLHIFNVQINWLDAACTTSVMFLVLAILPTIPVADIGIRGQTGLQLFGILSKNASGIVFTAAGIWLLNIIIPAVIGSLFVLSIKIFRNR